MNMEVSKKVRKEKIDPAEEVMSAFEDSFAKDMEPLLKERVLRSLEGGHQLRVIADQLADVRMDNDFRRGLAALQRVDFLGDISDADSATRTEDELDRLVEDAGTPARYIRPISEWLSERERSDIALIASEDIDQRSKDTKAALVGLKYQQYGRDFYRLMSNVVDIIPPEASDENSLVHQRRSLEAFRPYVSLYLTFIKHGIDPEYAVDFLTNHDGFAEEVEKRIDAEGFDGFHAVDELDAYRLMQRKIIQQVGDERSQAA